MREIVHIQAGQCGNQIGAKVGCKCYHFIEDWGYLYALFSRDFFYIDRFRHSNYFIHYFWHLLDRNRLTLYLKFDRLLVYILCKVRFSRTGLWECPPPPHLSAACHFLTKQMRHYWKLAWRTCFNRLSHDVLRLNELQKFIWLCLSHLSSGRW